MKTNPSIEQLLDIGREMLAQSDIDHVLKAAIDGAIEISGAERGLVILFDRDGDSRFQTARNFKKEDLDQPKNEISRAIIQKVKTEKTPVYLMNALESPEFQESRSIEKLRILSVICLPLAQNKKLFGAVYLDNRTVRGAFEPDTFEFARKFSAFISAAAFQALESKRLRYNVQALQKELRGKYAFDKIIGKHPLILGVLELVTQIADTEATVLIQGESGTGKELIAHALHENSRRKDSPFVAINCAALQESLLESELFGHVRGAFTGAAENRTGWFERADSGSIFLDEVAEMSPALQAKLLRVLQTGQFSPVGSSEVRQCSVRILAATNKNLQQLIKENKFRDDLYYRLNVIGLEAPPLRERSSDIPLLADYFVESFARKYAKGDLYLTPKAKAQLLKYDFPGNVRELENIIQRAVILAKNKAIEIEHFPASSIPAYGSFDDRDMTFKSAKQALVAAFEKNYIIDRLAESKGHISKAAQSAGLDIKNFHTKMKKYNIDPQLFKSNPKTSAYRKRK